MHKQAIDIKRQPKSMSEEDTYLHFEASVVEILKKEKNLELFRSHLETLSFIADAYGFTLSSYFLDKAEEALSVEGFVRTEKVNH